MGLLGLRCIHFDVQVQVVLGEVGVPIDAPSELPQCAMVSCAIVWMVTVRTCHVHTVDDVYV